MRAATFLGAILGAMIGLAVLLPPSGAQAQVWHGSDTGGIIPWSCESEAWAPQAAAEYCSRFRKYARITSVHRQYGDYIAFNCLWSPRVDHFARPTVRVRSACPGEPRYLSAR